ncbi:type II toxin-antitoxin system Phd/YefM family antitoxin [Inquilinus sp. Marseille-Q2685]|uniref:type II toxin-antitoxin system Phd/YefM family antitoxin n=1 Tax=Inquilinus sp. Marseille-Q2685 TaxID=2866581 RepID=UPI001CE41387|nr:type II toxin-antitoxin system Phd/YefM family antitoxin [Inquilinus sp. Marseille-Q2685]
MTITTLSSGEFSRNPSRARKLAGNGPVFITDGGRLANVLLTVEDYRKLTGGGRSIVDMLAMPGQEDIEFEPERLVDLPRPADLGSAVSRPLPLS